jgi:hypothetical protein
MSYEQLKNRSGLILQTEGTYQEGLFRLLAGKIDLFAGEDSMILKSAAEAGLDGRIKKAGKPFIERERCLAVHKNNIQLLKQLNNSLHGFVGSSEYQRIYLKWYGSPAPYWTTRKILIAGGIFLFIAVFGMALWRYISIFRINKELSRNIAVREQAEQALKAAVDVATKEKTKTEAIIAAMGDAINIQDTNYKILFQNEMSKGIYGEHAGEYCYKAFQNRDYVCNACHLDRIHGRQDSQIRSRRTGAGYHYEITASPLKTPRKNHRGHRNDQGRHGTKKKRRGGIRAKNGFAPL